MKKILISLFVIVLLCIFSICGAESNLNSGSGASLSGSGSGASLSGSGSGASLSGSASSFSDSSYSSESSSGSSNSGTTSSTPSSNSQSSSDFGTVIYPSDENILYSGRFDTTQSPDNYYGFSWSGCQISLSVTGTTTIKPILDSVPAQGSPSGENWFDVIVNNAILTPFNVSSIAHQEYNMIGSTSLDPTQTYSIVLSKRTEASFGEVRFYGFSVDSTGKTVPQSKPTRKIEFIGDSITCGYGDLGTAPCNFQAITEDNYDTYASITARELECEMYLEAWSGRGVVRNYGSPTPTSSSGTIPLIYQYTIPTDTSINWDFDQYIPDAVVINLGTNDYSTQPAPSQEQFQSGYIDFIRAIRKYYAQSPPEFFLICGPMINNPCCDYVANVSSIVGATYIDAQNILVEPTDFGCDGHPSLSGHTKLAAVVSPAIQKGMGW
ncbi:hypothetical protein ACTA71_008006 [Dictyostelium dimigraforme]